MVTFYSVPKLLQLSNGKYEKIVELLKSGKVIGDSYLLNLDALLNSMVDTPYKVEYLYFAAFRNYADYKLLGIDYLDISYIPDIDIVKVKRNPLISIENNQIKFIKEKQWQKHSET